MERDFFFQPRSYGAAIKFIHEQVELLRSKFYG